jgi:hypothetical protein
MAAVAAFWSSQSWPAELFQAQSMTASARAMTPAPILKTSFRT